MKGLDPRILWGALYPSHDMGHIADIERQKILPVPDLRPRRTRASPQ